MLTRLSLSAALVPRGAALLVLAGLLWGTGGLAGSLFASRTGMQPVAVAALRLLIGGIFITIYAAAAGGRRGQHPSPATVMHPASGQLRMKMEKAH